MYLVIQKERINFDYVLKYYIEGKNLYILFNNGTIIWYPYNSTKKVAKVINWIDAKLGIIPENDLVIEK